MEERIISPNKTASRAGLLIFMVPIAIVCCHMTPAHRKASGHTASTVNKIESNEDLFSTVLFPNVVNEGSLFTVDKTQILSIF